MHHAGVLSTSASQGHVLGAAAGSREGKWSPHSKDRGQVSEYPGSAHRSTVVMSSQWPSPTQMQGWPIRLRVESIEWKKTEYSWDQDQGPGPRCLLLIIFYWQPFLPLSHRPSFSFVFLPFFFFLGIKILWVPTMCDNIFRMLSFILTSTLQVGYDWGIAFEETEPKRNWVILGV